MADIMRGGWLAGKKRWITVAIAVGVPLAGYLSGDLDLATALQQIVPALFGM